jgi:ATP-dependent DNA helicase RecG
MSNVEMRPQGSFSPGRFPEGHTPEEFIKGRGHSLLRNPLIANTFYLASDIERWGSGLRRIYEACKDAGVTVDFQSIKTGFLVTFQRSEKPREKTREKTREKILRLIQERPEITTAELAATITVSPKAIEWHLKKLKEEGAIRRIGADKGGHWLSHET